MNHWTACALMNIGVCAAVIGGCYFTGSAWCMWGLVFMGGVKLERK